MLGIERNDDRFVPANNDEANGEIIGRCNALHDWLMAQAFKGINSVYRDAPLSDDLQTVCALMGFADVLRIKKEGTTEE